MSIGKYEKAIGKYIPSQLVGHGPPESIQFSALATECKAVNLGQGFPDTPLPHLLVRHMAEVARLPARTDIHQYTRGYGHPPLVRVLARLYSRLLNIPNIDPQSDVLITVGAYMALYYSFMGWLNPGDEVIIIEPAFDSYGPQVKLAGGLPVPVSLDFHPATGTSADFQLNMKQIEQKISAKTKMIVINNPHNPTGKLFSREELLAVARLAKEKDLLVIADEVYEWMAFPGNRMIRFASLPDMFERTITIGSASKSFSATGWRTGWAIAPKWLLEPLKKIHENCVFTCPTPIQEIFAQAFEEELEKMEKNSSDSYLGSGIARELMEKRDLLADCLRSIGFRPIVPQAGCFLIGDMNDLDWPEKESTEQRRDYGFVKWLCREKKLATIPVSAFYSADNWRCHNNFIRFCFFKKDQTLREAIQILHSTFPPRSA